MPVQTWTSALRWRHCASAWLQWRQLETQAWSILKCITWERLCSFQLFSSNSSRSATKFCTVWKLFFSAFLIWAEFILLQCNIDSSDRSSPLRIEAAANFSQVEISNDLFSVIKSLASSVLTTALLTRLTKRKERPQPITASKTKLKEPIALSFSVQLNVFHVFLVPHVDGKTCLHSIVCP